MRYANIIYNDLVNTDGVALTFFTQGCSHHCDGCFSKETWDFNGGKELTNEVIAQLDYVIKNYSYDYVCLIGGEPLDNIFTCETILSIFKKHHKSIKVWIYSGYTMREITKDNIKMNFINNASCVVTGRFSKEEYDPTLKFMGSRNQERWINENGEWRVVS